VGKGRAGAFVSIATNPARWRLVPQFAHVNQSIAEYASVDPRVDYIDVNSHMLGEDGDPKPDIFVADRLHMNKKGYRIWREVIGSYLAEQVGTD
jgi:lysophospholipase L1-like esterase